MSDLEISNTYKWTLLRCEPFQIQCGKAKAFETGPSSRCALARDDNKFNDAEKPKRGLTEGFAEAPEKD